MASQKLSQPTTHLAKRSDLGKPSHLSKEFVDESDDDAEDQDGGGAVSEELDTTTSTVIAARTSQERPKPQSNGKQHKGHDQAPASNSGKGASSKPKQDNTEAAHPEGRNNNTAKKTGQKPQRRKPASRSDNETSEDTESESEKGPPERQNVPKQAKEKQKVRFETTEPEPVETSRSAFKPPKDFKQVAVPSSYTLQSHISPNKLKGKELWHIIAPPDIPISSLTQATLVRRQTGETRTAQVDEKETILSHKGVDYALFEDEARGLRRTAYAPTAGSGAYSPLSLKVSRALRLQQKPDPLTQQISLNAIAEKASKPAPQQPSGLKIRYRPFGVASDDHFFRDTPSTRPAMSELVRSRSPAKRKAPDAAVNGENHEDPPSKKHKKDTDKAKKKNKHVQFAEPEVEAPEVQVPASQDATIKADGSSSDIDSSQPEIQRSDNATNGDHTRSEKHEDETPEEKGRRRAEKKRRKEEKLARKAARHAQKVAAPQAANDG